MKDEALKSVIKSMKSFQEGTNGLYKGEFDEEIAMCEAALAQPVQPVQEPVAWLDCFGEPYRNREDAIHNEEQSEPRPLVIAPPLPVQPVQPERQPLTNMQPLVNSDGVIRFKSNAIVQHLLDTHPTCDMNALACIDFTDEDRMQFAQLIGYSLSGYSDLSYVSDESYEAAEKATHNIKE